jgi:hypothetical protein
VIREELGTTEFGAQLAEALEGMSEARSMIEQQQQQQQQEQQQQQQEQQESSRAEIDGLREQLWNLQLREKRAKEVSVLQTEEALKTEATATTEQDQQHLLKVEEPQTTVGATTVTESSQQLVEVGSQQVQLQHLKVEAAQAKEAPPQTVPGKAEEKKDAPPPLEEESMEPSQQLVEVGSQQVQQQHLKVEAPQTGMGAPSKRPPPQEDNSPKTSTLATSSHFQEYKESSRKTRQKKARAAALPDSEGSGAL